MEIVSDTYKVLPPIKTIVFDFDGVIIKQSEFFKHEGWEMLFGSNTAAWQLFEDAEQKYGQGRGGDRYDILRDVYIGLNSDVVSEKIEKQITSGAQEFDGFVQQKILDAGIDPIDRTVLERLSKKYALYINSATPTSVLEKIIRQLKLVEVFKGILGRPHSKAENLKNIAVQEEVSTSQILFIGDGENDARAAYELQCHFLGYRNDWNHWKEEEQSFPVIRSFADIENWVNYVK